MHAIEEKILSLIDNNSYMIYEALKELYAIPLGKLSKEFYKDTRFITYYSQNIEPILVLRVALEEYIASDNLAKYLENVETAILKLDSSIRSSSLDQNKAAGTYLLPISSELIRQVYLLQDIPLSNLFKKHFPTPTSQLFEEGNIPDMIQKRDTLVLETMKKIDVKKIEPFIITSQRRIRMKKRYQEEINRIAQRDERHLKYNHMSSKEFDVSDETNKTQPEIYKWAKELLQNANKPYKPKCMPELSKRIMAAAKKVAAFSTVRHITSEKAIKSIFDDALYGRRTLMDFYLFFSPASLHECDILNGDANVACLGPQEIDPKANGGIVIEFDLPKLIKSKPAAFFKQRDLEFQHDKIRKVNLGVETISFNHSGSVRCGEPVSAYLQVLNQWNGLARIAEAPKSSLISYNLKKIHEILTMNFFRFMDKITDLKKKPDEAFIDDFYKKVSLLSDEDLVSFLTDLERNMTDTAEFNFYGAHKIDFSTVISINARFKNYILNIPKFIDDLRQGNINELRQARIKIPELFESYRFIDYLLSKIEHSDARYYLDYLRQLCKTPSWVNHIPLSIPEGFDLNWEISSESETLKYYKMY